MGCVIRSLRIGMPRRITDDFAEPGTWFSGFCKEPVSGPLRLGHEHLAGDGQADRTVHGGPEKALLAYSGDHYPQWSLELGRELGDGAFGENLTVVGGDEESVAIGDVFRIGSATVEVAQPRQPCWKLARRWGLPDLPAKAIASGRLGWYFRVLDEGALQAGDELIPMRRPNPAWTIARINRLFFGPPANAAPLFREAFALPGLSPEFPPMCRRRFPALAAVMGS